MSDDDAKCECGHPWEEHHAYDETAGFECDICPCQDFEEAP